MTAQGSASQELGVRNGDGDSGGWVTPDVSYIDPSRRFCAYCGRPIARRYWAASTQTELAYCDADHAARHTTYPRSGSNE